MQPSVMGKPLENVEIMALDASGNLREDVGPGELPGYLSDKSALVWCEISAEDSEGGPYWLLLTETFGFDPLTVEDCFNWSHLPTVTDYGSYLFMVLFSFHLSKETTRVCRTEVDLYLGENYVVCVHSGRLRELARVREKLRAKDEFVSSSATNVAHTVLDAVVDEYPPIMEALAGQVDEIEDELLGKERPKESVEELEDDLFGLKNHLTLLRRIVIPQRDNMAALLSPTSKLVPPESQMYFQDVRNHLERAVDSIDTMREHLTGTSEAYTTRATRRTSQDLQRLTVISTIFLPLAFITGLYGMNFEDMPELHTQYGYFVVLGVFVVLSALMVYYLRRKKLL